MNKNGQDKLGKHDWSYNNYFSGEMVDRNIRVMYRNTNFYEKIDINPFELSNSHLNELMNPIPKVIDDASISRKIIRKIIPFKIRKALKKIF